MADEMERQCNEGAYLENVDGSKLRVSFILTSEQIKLLDEWAGREYEGNRSMMIRKLIEREMERRLKE